MWRSRSNRDREMVVCIACGSSLSRADAREYDKEGDRWERHGKEFEHLCKACYRDLCHQPRKELEALLGDIEEHGLSQEEFLRRYLAEVEARYDPESREERER
ncbi:hypothetical protein SAMN04487948_10342 [Halogranum amylolyticum]|uniref:Small CPxCG-related zinc finger protein n=1 Tax=Halogranum amylolyticum TaxID=660520 RepID=A0A1H8QCL7_9EURY|nr:hypothetical protein [Halogranum amylolyticum]SEO51970.1 hypothetical protein SAMN04487948_10342 [Halogranum amylolyticum]